MKAKEYCIFGYVKKETGYNIAMGYKTKLSAEKRFNKMIASGCYEYIEMLIYADGKCIGGKSYG